MIRRGFGALMIVLVTAAAGLLPVSVDAGSGTVIVMPARTRVVQLVSQVARIKDVGLVAYNNSPALAAPLLHVWNGREWIQIGVDEYVSGSFLPAAVEHVFVLGDSTSLPASMTGSPKWAANVHKTADLNVASLLNEFGSVLKFTSGQWRWLADQNWLELNDRNAERRRYGRWGKSGNEAQFMPAPVPSGDVAPLPPAPEIREPTLPLPAPAVKVEQAPVTPATVTAPVIATPPVEATPVAEPATTNAPADATPVVTDPTGK